MTLDSPAVFRPDEFPDADPRLLSLLTSQFRNIYNALARVPTHAQTSGTFKSEASGVTTVVVLNPLPGKPNHISLDLRRDDLADFSAAWSWWRVIKGEHIHLKFIGLPASIKCAYSIDVS